MKDRKRMILIGAAALIVAAGVAIAAALVRHNSQTDIAEVPDETSAGEIGIGYGGAYEEIAYEIKTDEPSEGEESADTQTIPEERTPEQAADTQTQTETRDPELAQIEAEAEQIREEAQANLPGDIITEETLAQAQENAAVSGTPEYDDNGEIPIFSSNGYAEHEVLCDAESMEEAQQIADQIGGTVLDCEYGVARIEIPGSVDDLLDQLEKQGSKLELYRNYQYSIQ